MTLLQKLTVLQPVKKFDAFYGTQSFIIILIISRHWVLIRATWIQSTSYFSKTYSDMSSHLRPGLHILFLLHCPLPLYCCYSPWGTQLRLSEVGL
jgi:hypothetical protein